MDTNLSFVLFLRRIEFMKKIVLLATLSALALSLIAFSGCGKKKATAKAGAAAAGEAVPFPRVGM